MVGISSGKMKIRVIFIKKEPVGVCEELVKSHPSLSKTLLIVTLGETLACKTKIMEIVINNIKI